MFVRREARTEARRLRSEEGLSLREIAARVGAAKSSVSLWVRDIELTPEQRAALIAANPMYNGQHKGQRTRSESARKARAAWQAEGRVRAEGADDPLHRAGCMLYWAEGSKRRNVATMTNSDADLLAVFLRFLRECYGVRDERVAFSVNVHLGNGLSIDEVHGHWLEHLALPSSCLRKPTIVAPSADALRRRKLPYGTGRVCVASTELVQNIYGAIQAYAGIDRPEWLD